MALKKSVGVFVDKSGEPVVRLVLAWSVVALHRCMTQLLNKEAVSIPCSSYNFDSISKYNQQFTSCEIFPIPSLGHIDTRVTNEKTFTSHVASNIS